MKVGFEKHLFFLSFVCSVMLWLQSERERFRAAAEKGKYTNTRTENQHFRSKENRENSYHRSVNVFFFIKKVPIAVGILLKGPSSDGLNIVENRGCLNILENCGHSRHCGRLKKIDTSRHLVAGCGCHSL